LIDADKRQRYDQFGHAGVNGGSGFSGFDPSAFADFGDIFGDIFSDLFGMNMGGGRRGRPQRGGDARADLTLTFEEAAFGKKTQVKVRRYEACEQCHGSGSAGGRGPSTCSTCRGHGQVRYQQSIFSIARTCPTCQGTGHVISDPCAKCRGEARVMRERTVDVAVPPGVEDGTRIRYQEQGDAGPNGVPAGDLYVVLRVKPHSFFEREGKDLYCSVPVSFSQAALGSEIMIPTLDGEHKLKVPEGTQSGTTFRIRGKGLQALQSSGKGDLFVRVRVQTPSRLNKRQKELLEELGAMSVMENKPEPRSLFDKVKEIFG
jgi:molecular chaperone DnaJ